MVSRVFARTNYQYTGHRVQGWSELTGANEQNPRQVNRNVHADWL